MKTALVVVVVVMVLGASACKKPVEPPANPPEPRRERIEVMTPGGERTLLLDVEPGGYSLKDQAGWSIGQALIDSTTVRVTDREGKALVTVTRTSAGFSLDDGSGGPPLEGALSDEGLVLTRGAKAEGLLAQHALKLPDRTLFVVDNDALIQVVSGGDAVLEVRGHVGDGAAYLAWRELGFPERLALMLFSAELL